MTFPDRRYGGEAHPVQHRISHNSNNLEQPRKLATYVCAFSSQGTTSYLKIQWAGVFGGFVTCASAGGIHPPPPSTDGFLLPQTPNVL